MEATIVIPVWHGEQVILDCLKAVFAHSGEQLLEVICVDNASHDASATLIRDNFPQVTVLSQPVNLGFAGGVNTGLRAANGDMLILLNQDCMVQSGWLDALIEAAAANPALGIVGAHVLNADGSVNHAG
ncbi:MAG: glycosyltransferase, partial [Anaerolineales bacterium]|nr:glycosyltransferase [Anaerolineales bacterium]